MILREQVAYHEAAHAVAAWALWRPFEYVTIIPDGDRNGHLAFLPAPCVDEETFSGNYDLFVSDRAAITVAGYIADSVAARGSWPTLDDMWGRVTPDDRLAVDLACGHSSAVVDHSDPDHPETGVTAPLSMMYELAEGLIADYWGAIKAVAEALLADKTLTELQVATIAHSAPPVEPAVRYPSSSKPMHIPPLPDR